MPALSLHTNSIYIVMPLFHHNSNSQRSPSPPPAQATSPSRSRGGLFGRRSDSPETYDNNSTNGNGSMRSNSTRSGGGFFSRRRSSSSDSVVNQTDPNDASTFQLDSRLKKSFYGIAYTPEGSQLPDCGNSLGTFSRSTLTVGMLRTMLTRVRCWQSKSLRISRYSSGLSLSFG